MPNSPAAGNPKLARRNGSLPCVRTCSAVTGGGLPQPKLGAMLISARRFSANSWPFRCAPCISATEGIGTVADDLPPNGTGAPIVGCCVGGIGAVVGIGGETGLPSKVKSKEGKVGCDGCWGCQGC